MIEKRIPVRVAGVDTRILEAEKADFTVTDHQQSKHYQEDSTAGSVTVGTKMMSSLLKRGYSKHVGLCWQAGYLLPTTNWHMRAIMTWTCDSCGQPIHNAHDGWVEWLTRMGQEGSSLFSHSIRLVHYMPSSPIESGCQYDGNRAYTHNRDLVSDLGLDFFSSANGLTLLLQMLSDKEFKNPEEVLEMIKRLHLPNYEAARPYLDQAIAEGVFEPNSRPGYPHQDQLIMVRNWAGV